VAGQSFIAAAIGTSRIGRKGASDATRKNEGYMAKKKGAKKSQKLTSKKLGSSKTLVNVLNLRKK